MQASYTSAGFVRIAHYYASLYWCRDRPVVSMSRCRRARNRIAFFLSLEAVGCIIAMASSTAAERRPSSSYRDGSIENTRNEA